MNRLTKDEVVNRVNLLYSQHTQRLQQEGVTLEGLIQEAIKNWERENKLSDIALKKDRNKRAERLIKEANEKCPKDKLKEYNDIDDRTVGAG